MGLLHLEAWEYGLQEAKNGDIEIYLQDFFGQYRYSKKRDSNGKKQRLKVLRKHPDNIDPKNPGKKYDFPAGEPARPHPMNLAVERFKNGTTGGTSYVNEGFFKSLALQLQGLESVSVDGIGNYKLSNELREYLSFRKLDHLVIIYDGDAREIRQDKETGYYTDKRERNFYSSAKNFATSFFAWITAHNATAQSEAEKIKTKLFFCMVSERQPAKGIDDLIQAAGAQQVVPALESCETSEYFEFIELKKSRYEKQLNTFFAFTNQNEFYRHHRESIGFKPFTFAKVTYQRTIPEKDKQLFGGDGIAFKILDDPFDIDLEKASSIRINKYLTERKNTLFDIISREYKTYIAAPTGSAKTYLFAKHSKDRIVICVPTINLALQVATEYGIPAIIGGKKPAEITKALQAKKVVCTIEMLHAIRDLHSRHLILDEAHNLTNHYSFRDQALNYIYQAIQDEVPEKIVFLSGTPNKLLCKAWNFHFVEVSRQVNNQVLINPVTAKSASPKALQGATVEILQRIDWKANCKTHFVFWNSAKNINAVREWMEKYSELKPDEIAVINRKEVDAGNDKKYLEIITQSQLTGIKLVLCTSLIAEGININNQNIGEVLTVNLFCPDTFRQFVARFRKALQIVVHDIKPPERQTGKGWIKSTWREYQRKLTFAEPEKKHLERETVERYEELDDIDLEYPQISDPDYSYHSKFLNYAYTANGDAYINELRILSEIRDSIIQNSNNAFFYSQVTKQAGIRINSASEAIQAGDTITEQLTEVQTTIQERQEAQRTVLIADLKARPEIVVSALYKHYKDKRDHKQAKRIKKQVPGLIQDSKEAEQYRISNPDIFANRAHTGLILDAIRLHAIQLPPDEIAKELDNYKPAKFAETWTAYQYQVEYAIYRDRNKRKILKSDHRLDLKAFEAIRKVFDSSPPETLSSAQREINRLTKAAGLESKTEAETLSILKRLYQVEAKAGFSYQSKQYWKKQNGLSIEKHSIRAQRDKILSIKAHPELFSNATATRDYSFYAKLFL